MRNLVLLVAVLVLPATAVAGWEVAFFDDFNRPDGPVGAPWFIAGPDTPYISSGRVICPFDTSYGLIAYLHDESGPSTALEMDFSFFGDSTGYFHGWIAGITDFGDTVAYGAEMERGLFGLYFYPPESLIVEKPFTYDDYSVYSMRLAYDHSTGIASLTIRDVYGVASDSIGVTGAGCKFDRIYVGIENHDQTDAKWLDNATMWLIPYSGMVTDRGISAPAFELYPALPNPCNDGTMISYRVPAAGDVSLAIFDVMGRKVMSLNEAGALPGLHEVRWDATTEDGARVTPGIYICTVKAGAETRSGKIAVTR